MAGLSKAGIRGGMVAGFALLVAGAFGCGTAPPPPEAPWNLLLVTLDTVRADRLGAYGYAAAETPRLDGLARQGLVFEAAMAAAPLTLPAHATLLSGLWPPRHGLHNNGAGSFPAELPTLATSLSAAGYRTGAFVGAFVLDRRFGLARGFATYDDAVPRNPDAAAGFEAERPGAEVVDRALAWLQDAGEGAGSKAPFFAWVHLFDAHAPYEPPEPYRTRHAGRPYDGEIAAVDAQVGRLLDALEHSGAAARTVVAVVADHGEALGDHGELTHGLLLYEPTVRVPLMIRAPGRLPAGRRIAEPVSAADLAPTLAGLLARPLAPTVPLDGRDLSADLGAGRAPPTADLYAESRYPELFGWSGSTALRRGRHKWIEAPRPELYDLATDPSEQQDLRAQERRTAAELAAALTALTAQATRAQAARPNSQSTPTTDDAATRALLASLGYVAATGAAPAAGAGRDPKDAIPLFRAFEQAHWDLNAGRAREAMTGLERLLVEDPANGVFRANLAEAARQAGEGARAAELYRQVVAAAPHDAQNWYNLAVTLREIGAHGEASTAFGEALRRNPGHAESRNALGILLSLQGQLAQARGELEQAVALDPINPTVHNNLANVLRSLRDDAGAERHYREAIRLAPRYPDPENGLGVLAVERDRPAEALVHFERALELAPGRHEVRLNRAVALQMVGDRSRALAAYQQFLSASAGDPEFAEQRKAVQTLIAQWTAATSPSDGGGR